MLVIQGWTRSASFLIVPNLLTTSSEKGRHRCRRLGARQVYGGVSCIFECHFVPSISDVAYKRLRFPSLSVLLKLDDDDDDDNNNNDSDNEYLNGRNW